MRTELEDGESKEDELARINSSALAPRGAVFGRTWPSDFSNTLHLTN